MNADTAGTKGTMDPDVRAEVNELSLALLKQDARLAALQIMIVELLHLKGEQLDAFLDRLVVHNSIQLRALAERLQAGHPEFADRVRREAKMTGQSSKK